MATWCSGQGIHLKSKGGKFEPHHQECFEIIFFSHFYANFRLNCQTNVDDIFAERMEIKKGDKHISQFCGRALPQVSQRI